MINNLTIPRIKRWSVLISLKDLKTELANKIADYYTQQVSEYAPELKGCAENINLDAPLGALLQELFTERQSDMRNAGRLELTENQFRWMAIDERQAHEFAELLFVGVVNALGQHIPNITFSNHEGYKFQIMRYDVLIYKE